MAVDEKMMKAEDFAKVSSIDFVYTFNKNMKQLTELLGITRKIEKVPGQTVKTYKVTGTLEDGTVAEGEEIPLSKYKTEVADIFELALKKYRKQTTYEAINDKGYEQAVEDTDSKMLFDIQAVVRNEFFTFLKTGTGAATPTGTGIQGALAAAWGKNQVYWEDYDTDGFLYFVNALDIADYLGNKDITVETVFGMNYIENFLGLYDVVAYSGIEQGKVITTAKQNLILYYTNPTNSEVAKAFEFITDSTGLIGVHRNVDYKTLTTDTTAVTGSKLFAELLDGIVKVDIKATAAQALEGTEQVETI